MSVFEERTRKNIKNKLIDLFKIPPMKVTLAVGAILLFSVVLGIATLFFLENFGLKKKEITQVNSRVGRTNLNRLGNPDEWETYHFEKMYENGYISFEIRYPPDWRMVKKTETIEWYGANPNFYILKIAWLNPDIIYDIESVCPKECVLIDEVIPPKGQSGFLWATLWKPTLEGRKSFNLSNSFIYGNNQRISGFIIAPDFSTELLQPDEFKTIISTFQYVFLDHPTEVVLPVIDESLTRDWQEFAYFKYPKDYTVWGENYFLSVRKGGNKGQALDIYWLDSIKDLESYLNEQYSTVKPITINNLEGFIVLDPASTQDYQVFLNTKSGVIKLIVRKNLPVEVKKTIALIIGTFYE